MDFEVLSQRPIRETTFHPKIMEFTIQPHEREKDPVPDTIKIEHIFSIPERFKNLSDEKALSLQGHYLIFQENETWIYKTRPASPAPESMSVFMESSRDFSRNRVYCHCITAQEYGSGAYPSMTIFGYDQIIISKLLSTRQGVLVHANGFVSDRQGFLLTGPSTAGKTTLSNMLREKGFRIFSDDRAIVRFDHDQWFMEGSWFHGSTPITSTGAFPLKGIFFLEHARENTIVPLPITSEEWQSLLGTVEKLSQDIPCHQLRFDLSGDIVSHIIRLTATGRLGMLSSRLAHNKE